MRRLLPSRPRRAIETAAGLLVCASAAACVHEAKPPPNIILVTIDTLRADHLGCYGYGRNTSPFLDAFAERATRYTRAYATSPWTVPSHASLFTGMYPFEHGAHTFKLALDKTFGQKKGIDNVHPLAEEHTTLAEFLRDRGYRTGAIVANGAYLVPRHGFDQGFDTYDVKSGSANYVNRRVFSWLAARDDRPFFLFVNYMDAHRPYNANPVPGFLDRPVPDDSAQVLDALYDALAEEEIVRTRTEQLVATLTDQYDLGIANVDAGLRRLFEHIASEGLFEDAVVVITSDHGEFLGEHDLVEHSKDVYDEALRIPMIVKAPRQRRREVIDRLASLAHVPQLVLEHTAWSASHSLRAACPEGRSPVLAENHYSRLHDLRRANWGYRFDRVRRVIYDDRWKYISSSDGRHELYNVLDDPLEQDNLLTRGETPEGRKLAAELDRCVSAVESPAPSPEPTRPLTDQEIERLKSLGYL